MNKVLFFIFVMLAMMQPNAQKGTASGLITLAQFMALIGTYLTTDRKR